jgi:hypothetical protein
MDYFRFLELPPEIRNQIYQLLLTATSPPGKVSGPSQSEVDAAILRVNRKLHAECKALLYANNVFHAHPARLASLPFLRDISRPILSPDCCRLIKRYYIEVRLDIDNPWDGDDCAKAFNGVEELHVVAWQASFGQCNAHNLIPFAKVRGVRHARVEGTSLEPAMVKWLEEVMQSDADRDEIPTLPSAENMESWDVWAYNR